MRDDLDIEIEVMKRLADHERDVNRACIIASILTFIAMAILGMLISGCASTPHQDTLPVEYSSR